MRLLLDTHTLLWFALGDGQISPAALALINDAGNDKLVSPASYWEIAIKVSIGKLTLNQPYEDFIDRGVRQNGFDIPPSSRGTRDALRCCLSITRTRSTACS